MGWLGEIREGAAASKVREESDMAAGSRLFKRMGRGVWKAGKGYCPEKRSSSDSCIGAWENM